MGYEMGQPVRLPVTVRDAAGVATAATVTYTVTREDGTVLATPATQAGAGVGDYYADVTPDVAGLWRWRAVASGAVTAVFADQFYVRGAGLRLLSLAEAKTHLNKSLASTADDDEIMDWVDAITRVIEDRVGAVVPRTVTETHSGGRERLFLRAGPVLDVVSVVESWAPGDTRILAAEPVGGPYTDDQYTVDVDTRSLSRRGSGWAMWWPAGTGNVTVIYTAGRRPIPINFKQAAQEILAHHWRASQIASGATRPKDPVLDAAGAAGLGIGLPNRAVALLGGSRRAPMLGGG